MGHGKLVNDSVYMSRVTLSFESILRDNLVTETSNVLPVHVT